MNILIVDDEKLTVDSIAASLHWSELGIHGVYKAFSMEEAKKVFKQTDIDILLCDIEMPRGSGIALMEWVKKNDYQPVCIFLTSFSSFEYASSAIRLQMFDYVLKLCENDVLENVIARAAQKSQDDKNRRRKEILGEYWDDGYQSLVSDFWDALLKGTVIPEKAVIQQSLKARHLSTAMSDELYYLFVLQVVPDTELAEWSDHLWRYAVRNIVTELLCSDVILTQENTFVSISRRTAFPSDENYDMVCEDLIQALSTTLPARFYGYYGKACTMQQAAAVYTQLLNNSRAHYAMQSTVFKLGAEYTIKTLPALSEERWQKALMMGNTDLILEDVEGYLTPGGPGEIINRNLLKTVYHHILNTIYNILELYHLPAHQPFLERELESTSDVFTSIPDFVLWAKDTVENAMQLIAMHWQTQSVVADLIDYIQKNLNSDLNRTQLGNAVHLHPDYLASLFRKEKGCSISEYITKERIKSAKGMLLSTDMPVSEIATRTGFQTISYFSKQFKHLEKITPLQFRQKQRNAICNLE